jgi:hypothetical protein
MKKQPLLLTPEAVRVLALCPLHYHFRQTWSGGPVKGSASVQAGLDELVRESIQYLHATGGPARLSLERCLERVGEQPLARQMIERYYRRLEQDWPWLIAGNETIALKISLGGVALALQGTVDRLDKTADGGVVAILFRTGSGPVPAPADLRQDHAITIYHALVAATYPLKRPVRIRELWLQPDQSVEVELSEAEYRHNLSHLREPVQALARGEVRARPGLHCDICPFKYRGCPVYQHEAPEPGENQGFDPTDSPGKIPHRKWIFKI